MDILVIYIIIGTNVRSKAVKKMVKLKIIISKNIPGSTTRRYF